MGKQDRGNITRSVGSNAPGGTRKRIAVSKMITGFGVGKGGGGKRTKSMKLASGATTGISTPPQKGQ